jgi:hypothetical protein
MPRSKRPWSKVGCNDHRFYVIERDVKIARETGEVDLARARWEQCLPIMDTLYVWLAKQNAQHPPKSVTGNAINYTLQELASPHSLHHQHRDPSRQQPKASERSESSRLYAKIGCFIGATRTQKTQRPSSPSSHPAGCTRSIPQQYLDEILRILRVVCTVRRSPYWPRDRYLELAPNNWPACTFRGIPGPRRVVSQIAIEPASPGS